LTATRLGARTMTVSQLIEILRRYEPSMPVMVSDSGGTFDATAFDVQIVRVPPLGGNLALCISPHETAAARQVLEEVKCPRCGWVHVAIPRHHAEQSVRDENAERLRAGAEATAAVSRYFRCFRCGGDTCAFVPATEADAPNGCTLQAVVIDQNLSTQEPC
jgi:hypothetical protein